MENKKDIGKAINDRLSSLDKTPREEVWSGISYELKKKKKRRFGLFFFWGTTIGVVFAGMLFGLHLYDEKGGFQSDTTAKVMDSIGTNHAKETAVTANPELENSINESDKTDGVDSTAFDDKTIKKNESGIKGQGGIDGKNAFGNRSSANGKNSFNKANNPGNIYKNNANKNRVNGIGNKSAPKSSRNGNPNAGSSKSAKSKSKLLSYRSKKNSGKKAHKATHKNKNGGTNFDSLQIPTSKNSNSTVDLSALEGKIKEEFAAETKAKKKDSTAVKKPKDKTITIKMYPKDSVKTDSETTYRKIQVDVFVSPTLYGYFSNGSTIDRRLDSLPKQSEIKFSYGLGITYDLTERLSVRLGYQKINIAYTTKNAPIDVSNYNGIRYNPTVSNQTILTAFNALGNIDSLPTNMDITQKISYTDISLQVKYKLLARKIGLKPGLGFSYLLLDENKVSIETTNGFRQDIGETKNISGSSFSLNFGLEADYPIFKKTKVFIEPMLQYQLKAFSGGNYKPYIFGVHTGIRYSFN